MALALILYEGGLSSGWAEIRPVIGVSIALATLGTLLTAGITAIAAGLLFDQLSALEALIWARPWPPPTPRPSSRCCAARRCGARSRARSRASPASTTRSPSCSCSAASRRSSTPTSGSRTRSGWPAASSRSAPPSGLLVGGLGVFVLQRVTLPSAGLYPVASVAFAGLAYGGAATLHGTGFLAVFIAGLVVGSASSPARRTIVTFHEGLAWVAQLALFLLLGLLVNPAELIEIIPEGAAIALVTAVVARPLAALIVAHGFTLPERLMLGWAGLRGATPIVFATFPVTEGIPNGDLIFKVAFFVVLISTVVQGLTIEPVARWLGVTSDEAAIPAPLVEPVLLNRLGAETMQFPVRGDDAVKGHPVRELGLPREALLNVIVRGERAIPPRGSTVVEEGDQLHVLVRQEVAVEFRELMRRWRTGPIGLEERPRRRPRSRPSVTSIRPWQDSDGDPQRPKVMLGQRGGRAVAHPARRARRARAARGRPLRRSPARCWRSGRRASCRPSRGAGSSTPPAPSERAWWQEVVGALAR